MSRAYKITLRRDPDRRVDPVPYVCICGEGLYFDSALDDEEHVLCNACRLGLTRKQETSETL